MRPSTAEAARIAEEAFGVTGVASDLAGEIDHNFLIEADGERFVLKIGGTEATSGGLRGIVALLSHLAGADLPIATPQPTPTRDGRLLAHVGEAKAALLTWVEGVAYASADRDSGLAERIGRIAAQLCVAMSNYEPESRRHHPWDLANTVDIVTGLADAIDDPQRRAMVMDVVADYQRSVAPLWEALPKQQIHNDINDLNLLVAAGDIAGLIDFGDTVWSARVAELAVAATYAMLRMDDPVAEAAGVVSGFAAVTPLEPREAAVLFPLILARLAISVVHAESRAETGNPHHLVSREDAWDLLERLHAADAIAVAAELSASANHRVPARTLRRDLLERRGRVLPPSLSLHYDEPLVITRGAGAYLYDDRARRYLDCVNNVAHVGHANPRVVAAETSQSRVLNTNTRYLHPAVIELAERLTATLPPHLDVAVFTNSGSEANELALRMARSHTRRHDVAVLADGYHGNTAAMVDISPYKFAGPGGGGKPEWVHVLETPDPYRSRYGGQHGPDAFGAHTRDVLERAGDSERTVAAFFAEAIVGCGGQVVPAPGVLAAAVSAVRDSGGIYVADEVQTGFGRVGESFWAFQLHGVEPDIVTLGKPFGNGHPLGAVVTTADIAESFATGMEYFNTFGGNPVSARVGLAVLDEIGRLDLQANALEVGTYLQEELLSLADAHRVIGDVRGSGLFLGIELVADRQSREPAAGLTNDVVEHARRSGVLLSIDGPHHNVIKVKPPLVFTADDADRLVAALAAALADLA